MVLLVQRKDLRPLLDDSKFMATAIDAFEEVFREYQRGEAHSYPYLHLPLNGEGRALSVLPASSPTNGVALRISPVFGGARGQVDSRVVVLFDPNNGQVEALVAD